jgi:hypothetical protein
MSQIRCFACAIENGQRQPDRLADQHTTGLVQGLEAASCEIEIPKETRRKSGNAEILMLAALNVR